MWSRGSSRPHNSGHALWDFKKLARQGQLNKILACLVSSLSLDTLLLSKRQYGLFGGISQELIASPPFFNPPQNNSPYTTRATTRNNLLPNTSPSPLVESHCRAGGVACWRRRPKGVQGNASESRCRQGLVVMARLPDNVHSRLDDRIVLMSATAWKDRWIRFGHKNSLSTESWTLWKIISHSHRQLGLQTR